jgi:uncharacterized protein (TIGR02996 family)
MQPVAMEQALFRAIHDNPEDDLARLALADWLEEQGQVKRAELLRLDLELRDGPSRHRRRACERRIRALLMAGVRPCVPTLVNSLGMELVLIRPGAFTMGSPESQWNRLNDECPAHQVEITRPFYLAAHLVTQRQYQDLTGVTPSHFRRSPDLPVEQVSWEEADRFCRRLSRLAAEREAGRTYRLPSEAEWEDACRAETTSTYFFGEDLTPEQANFDSDGTTPVGSYPPNAWGLFDMHGNVWEWCADYWDADYYAASPAKDPLCTVPSDTRSIRGGAWFGAYHSAIRQGWSASFRYKDLGFRVACDLASPGS